MDSPVEPRQEDCCGSGCDPCIFDVYQRQLQLYEKYKTGQIKHDNVWNRTNIISETSYTPFKIVSIKKICKDHAIIAFIHDRSEIASDDPRKLYWKPGQHFLMKYCNKNLTSSKAYTPLRLSELTDDGEMYDFMILLKQYTGGLVSNYLHSQMVGDNILWRGPYGSFRHNPNKYNRICMISQGTGVAPCYSIIKEVLDNENDFTTIIFLCSYRDVNTMLLRNELYAFMQYWNFNYKIFLSRNNAEKSVLLYKEPVIPHKMEACDVRDAFWPVSQLDQFLICGSPDFMNCIKNILTAEGLTSESIYTF